MLFDTWGGVLTPAQYEEFSLRYMAQIVDALTRKSEGRRVPNIVFTKGGGAWLAKIAGIGCDAVGVDWTTDLKRGAAGGGRTCRPAGQSRSVGAVRAARYLARRNLAGARELRRGRGHVFNLGHGITPDVDPERVALLVEPYRPTARQG